MTASADIALRDPERFATLAFLSIKGVGTVTCNALRDAFGSLADALEAGLTQYAEVLRKNQVERVEGDPHKGAHEALAWCAQQGADLIFPSDASWPKRIEDLRGSTPQLLFVRGKLDVDARAVSVVGTRRPTENGRFAGRRLGKAFAQHQVLTVSGGADGVDSAAHHGALEGSGRTWGVLAAGFKHMYPAGNRDLFEEIVQNGALITEYPPDHENDYWMFVRRNSLIAALSEAVVIVEGDNDSGAMHTVRAAEKLGRPVFAVPGELREEKARAPLMLLRTGRARICAHSSDVLLPLGVVDKLENVGEGEEPTYQPIAAGPAEAPLDASLQPALQALGRSPSHLDDLAQRVGWPAPQLLAALTQLELLGLCEQRPGKLFVRRVG